MQELYMYNRHSTPKHHYVGCLVGCLGGMAYLFLKFLQSENICSLSPLRCSGSDGDFYFPPEEKQLLFFAGIPICVYREIIYRWINFDH